MIERIHKRKVKMKNIRVAKRYALAMFNSAKEMNILDTVRTDVALIEKYMHVSHEFRAVMHSPIIQAWRKKGILKELLEKDVHGFTLSFMELLCDKGREDLHTEIFNQFTELYNVHNRLLPIVVTSAVALTDSAKATLENNIQTKTAMKPIASYKIDSDLKGGLTVLVGDTLLDNSVRSQLDRLYHSLQSGL